MELVGKEFEGKIKYYALVWWPARSSVLKAIDTRFEVFIFFKNNIYFINQKKNFDMILRLTKVDLFFISKRWFHGSLICSTSKKSFKFQSQR